MNDFSRQYPVTVDEDRPIGAALSDMARLGVRSLLVVNETEGRGLDHLVRHRRRAPDPVHPAIPRCASQRGSGRAGHDPLARSGHAELVRGQERAGHRCAAGAARHGSDASAGRRARRRRRDIRFAGCSRARASSGSWASLPQWRPGTAERSIIRTLRRADMEADVIQGIRRVHGRRCARTARPGCGDGSAADGQDRPGHRQHRRNRLRHRQGAAGRGRAGHHQRPHPGHRSTRRLPRSNRRPARRRWALPAT